MTLSNICPIPKENSRFHKINTKIKLTHTIFVLIALSLSVSQQSCNKLVEVDAPITGTNSENIYATDATAAAVLTGLYTKMSNSVFSNGGLTSMSLFPALAADELTLFSGATQTMYTAYYKNALINLNTSTSVSTADFWSQIYPIIYVANSAIEGLTGSKSLTPTIRNILIGEAKFLRAFCYFYLVSLYGDVPIALYSDYKQNAKLVRASISEVFKQIIFDLKDAQANLSDEYLNATLFNVASDRVRPNKWAATALLSRVYLYVRDYGNAEIQATSVINNSRLFSLPPLNEVFLKSSKEAIWQLQPVISGQNTQDALMFILPSTGPSNSTAHPVYLSEKILNSFELGDQRLIDWVDSVKVNGMTYYYPFKYKVGTLNKPVTEYLMVLRLTEQYLIRAEAEAELNKISEAQADLNIVRNRAGLSNIIINDKSSLLTAILHERKVELFTEWGHRWLDLKRTGNLDAVMGSVTAYKGSTWHPNWQWFPIPITSLLTDPNLVQNPGY